MDKNIYTAIQFRDNMREALNRAEAGKPVFIARHKKVFKVILIEAAQGDTK